MVATTTVEHESSAHPFFEIACIVSNSSCPNTLSQPFGIAMFAEFAAATLAAAGPPESEVLETSLSACFASCGFSTLLLLSALLFSSSASLGVGKLTAESLEPEFAFPRPHSRPPRLRSCRFPCRLDYRHLLHQWGSQLFPWMNHCLQQHLPEAVRTRCRSH